MKFTRVVVWVTSLALGCGAREELVPLPTESLLTAGDTVEFEEGGAPISDITFFDIRREMGIAIVDRPARTVRLYGRDGTFLRELPQGKGPGEVADPASIAILPDGTVAIGEFGQARVATFTWEGAYAGSFAIPQIFAQQLVATDDSTLVVGVRDMTRMFFVAFRRMNGEWTSLGERSEWDPRISATAYWPSVAMDYASPVGRSVVVVNNLLFGAQLLSARDLAVPFAAPPKWWQAPSVPKLGSLSGVGGRRALVEWLGTLTVVDGVAHVGDVLAVSVGRYSRERMDRLRDIFATRSVAWCLYAVPSGEHIGTVAAPGRLVGGGEYLWTADPADTLHGWRLIGWAPADVRVRRAKVARSCR